jgi:SAM-dependent methyltransferase
LTTKSVFDTDAALRIHNRRKEFADRVLSPLVRPHGLRTALDVGCGFGFFSRYLADTGFQTTALDVRPENIAEAKRRNPDVESIVANLEELPAADFASFDVVLCFGLLYHLENPFRAIRNLEALTQKILLVETVIAPYRSQAAILYEEEKTQNQGIDYIALIPSESWMLKCLYKVGFPFVYQTKVRPDHKDFRETLWRRRRRAVLVASKVELDLPILRLAPEPAPTAQYLWDRWGLSRFLRSERLRNLLKKAGNRYVEADSKR